MRLSKIREVKTPCRGTKFSAGIDFFIPNDIGWEVKTLRQGESILIPSGIKAEVPKGCALVAMNKSGIATKKNLVVGACLVDEDYQGEIHIHLINIGRSETSIQVGEKIAQFVLVPVFMDHIEVVPIDELYMEQSERGDGAFGSTNTIHK